MKKRGTGWYWAGRLTVVVGLLCAAPPAPAQPEAGGASFWNEATLYRDEFGTPHIEAGSIRAMASAFGYAQAEDHLEPMLMAYRIALGRAAEVGGEVFAESDAFAIKIGNAEQSAIALGQADPVTLDLCEGFALGVNAWILEHQDRVPAWAEGVQPKDVLAWWHYLMVAQTPFDLPGVYHPKAPLERANAWALAPGNTLEGSTLLVMNPQEYYDSPYRWYEAHLMAGEMNLAGATLFGVPVLMMGHNENAGWALTPNLADTADFFREQIGGPQTPGSDAQFAAPVIDDAAPLLRFMSTAKPYFVRTSAGLVERAVPSMIGTRGPIFEGGDGALYSWRNGAFLQFGGLRQMLMMGQSTGVAEMKDALAMHQLPGFQVVCADKSGELYYRYNARLGNRDAAASPSDRQPMNWSMPVDSGRDVFAWREVIAPGLLPQIERPASGYVQACGTPPWLATTKSGLNAADWPRWLVGEGPNYRGFRVNQILSARKYSFFDMQAMLFDTHVPAAADMVPLLLAMARKRPELVRTAHPDLLTALRLLEGWNLSSDRESTAMAYYSIWWALMKKRHSAQFGSEQELYQGLLANTPQAQVQALDAAVEAARIMRNDFGALSIPWGNLHRIQRGARNEAAPGTDTGDSIFHMDNQSFTNRQWRATFGTGFAMVVQFGERTQAASIVPFGASELADSPHFGDQLDLFLARRMKPTNFQYGTVIERASSGFGTRILLGTPGLDGHCTVHSAQPQQARLEAIQTPPGPLPVGLAGFTPAFRPVFAAGASAHTWELELRVPDEICAAESLNRLQIFVHTLEAGWRRLPEQRFDGALGAFVGQGNGSMIIAVLGPEEALKKPEAPEFPAPGAAPADDFLRAPLPIPVMENEGAPDGAVASAEAHPEAAVAGEGSVPGDSVAAGSQPTTKPLFDLEFMDQPGVPQPASSLFSGPDSHRSDGGDGKKKEKKRKKKEPSVEEATDPAPPTPEAEEKPRNAKKKLVQEPGTRTRAPRTNFN